MTSHVLKVIYDVSYLSTQWMSFLKAESPSYLIRQVPNQHVLNIVHSQSAVSVLKIQLYLDFSGGSKLTADGDCSHEIKRHLLLGRKAMTNLESILKSRKYHFVDKGLQSYGFSRNHVWMWELAIKEGWVLKNWCFWTVVFWESCGLQDQTIQS